MTPLSPVISAALLLAIVLVVPLLSRKIHLPSVVGLILTGILIGPYGLHVLDLTPTLKTFCRLGILYIMFLAGVEIDLDEFRLERRRSLVFGLLTFFIPFALGLAAAWAFSFPVLPAVLFASLFSSHTLITWPVVSRYGVQRNAAASIAVGATIYAVTGAMLVLAAVSTLASAQDGAASLPWLAAWLSPVGQVVLRLTVGGTLMLVCVFAVMPRLARWFFYQYNDSVAEWLFVMFLAAAGGALAYMAGIEPILGVFLTALALNRYIPRLSPLMNRISFVGNAVFIPVFLLGVGMLINLRVLANGWYALVVAVVMTVIALASKWLAAAAAAKAFRFSALQRRLLFGLTNSHAAGALATVTIGYSIIMADGSHLLSEEVLNGTVLLILVSCAVSSFMTEQAAGRLSTEAAPAADDVADDSLGAEMQVLVPVANPGTTRRLVELATLLINSHPESRLHAAAVMRSADDASLAERLLADTVRQAAATDHEMMAHRQLAVNIPNGIREVAQERRITHIVMGVTIGRPEESGYGKVAGPLIQLAGQQIWLCHAVTPLSLVRQVRVLVPEHAEVEPDYSGWQITVGRMLERLGTEVTQETVTSWDILPRIAATMSAAELLVIVQARRSTASYHPDMDRVPDMLRTAFTHRNVIVLFPRQHVEEEQGETLLNEYARSGESTYSFIRRLTSPRH